MTISPHFQLSEPLTFNRIPQHVWEAAFSLTQLSDTELFTLYTRICKRRLRPSEEAILSVSAELLRGQRRDSFSDLLELASTYELAVYDLASAYRTIYQPMRPGSGVLLMLWVLGGPRVVSALEAGQDIKLSVRQPEAVVLDPQQPDLLSRNPWELHSQNFTEEAVSALLTRLGWPTHRRSAALTVLDDWA